MGENRGMLHDDQQAKSSADERRMTLGYAINRDVPTGQTR